MEDYLTGSSAHVRGIKMDIHNIALMPGYGIGSEIVAEGRNFGETVADIENFSIKWNELVDRADHILKQRNSCMIM